MRHLLRLLTHWPIAMKLVVMAVAGALCMVLVALTVLQIARHELVAERTQKAHAVVDAIWSMADHFQHEATAGKMTEAEAKARFFAAAGSIWWEGHSNYAFIYDTETAKNLMNTGNTALVGRDMRAA
jgi:methyl-accepting chemotaxis protein